MATRPQFLIEVALRGRRALKAITHLIGRATWEALRALTTLVHAARLLTTTRQTLTSLYDDLLGRDAQYREPVWPSGKALDW